MTVVEQADKVVTMCDDALGCLGSVPILGTVVLPFAKKSISVMYNLKENFIVFIGIYSFYLDIIQASDTADTWAKSGCATMNAQYGQQAATTATFTTAYASSWKCYNPWSVVKTNQASKIYYISPVIVATLALCFIYFTMMMGKKFGTVGYLFEVVKIRRSTSNKLACFFMYICYIGSCVGGFWNTRHYNMGSKFAAHLAQGILAIKGMYDVFQHNTMIEGESRSVSWMPGFCSTTKTTVGEIRLKFPLSTVCDQMMSMFDDVMLTYHLNKAAEGSVDKLATLTPIANLVAPKQLQRLYDAGGCLESIVCDDVENFPDPKKGPLTKKAYLIAEKIVQGFSSKAATESEKKDFISGLIGAKVGEGMSKTHPCGPAD
jgi:hypothetical protein